MQGQQMELGVPRTTEADLRRAANDFPWWLDDSSNAPEEVEATARQAGERDHDQCDEVEKTGPGALDQGGKALQEAGSREDSSELHISAPAPGFFENEPDQ